MVSVGINLEKENNSAAVLILKIDKHCFEIKNKLLPDGSDGKEPACNAGDKGSIPWLGRSPREGKGNPLQCSWLRNPMDRGAWWATVCGATELDRTERLNTHISSLKKKILTVHRKKKP